MCYMLANREWGIVPHLYSSELWTSLNGARISQPVLFMWWRGGNTALHCVSITMEAQQRE
jgi:hypothetical protein